MKIENFILENDLGIILKDKRFKDVTTMKVGGKIKKLYFPNSVENLLEVINFLNHKKKKFFVLGNGSNTIASDKPFNTLVICGKHLVKDIIFAEDKFIVSGFADLRTINAKLIQKNISTFLTLSGIPATIGGALVMNAGAFKGNISDNLLWVECIVDGKIEIYEKEQIEFSYRKSSFKNKNVIIINAAFKLIEDSNSYIKYQEIIEKRKLIHPLEYPNSGSIFRNIENQKAYTVIRKLNLVDYFIGGATFSDKHANFIINKNNASSNDVYKLIILAKKMAYIYENIVLEEEVILLNFPSYGFYKKIIKN